MDDFLYREYGHNTVLAYLIALAIMLSGTLVLRLFRRTLLARLKQWTESTDSAGDDFLVAGVSRFGIPALQYGVVYVAINTLNLSSKAERVVVVISGIVITFLLLRLLSSVVLLLLKGYIRRQERGEEKIKQVGGLMLIINIVIWILGIVFLIDNLGYNITSIVTGLGIGGIAVALAAQNILGDLFNYFVIFFDRPFEVGDFIIVDDKMGTIEYIGVKTTRIRSLSGEQLVIGNSNLTNSRIHNFKRQQERRIVFTVDVDYLTPLPVLQRVPPLLRDIVSAHKTVRFDRAHFAAYKDWGLRFEIVYIVLTADYNIYMDIQQELNFAIFAAFHREGIQFALPTQLNIESASRGYGNTHIGGKPE